MAPSRLVHETFFIELSAAASCSEKSLDEDNKTRGSTCYKNENASRLEPWRRGASGTRKCQ
jgi:hypothetical protein